jgi:hypothetical protein
MAVNPSELAGPDAESARRTQADLEAFMRQQVAADAGDLVISGYLGDEIPETGADRPYDGEEGAEDVEPIHVTGIEPDGSPFEPTYEEPGPEPDPARSAQPVKPAAPRPRPRSRNGRPLKARNWRERAARDSGSHLKPFPYGSKED